MKPIDLILKRMSDYSARDAIYENGIVLTYSEFIKKIDDWEYKLSGLKIHQGTVCAVIGEFSTETCALFFALIKCNAIIVPLTKTNENENLNFLNISGAEVVIEFQNLNEFRVVYPKNTYKNQLIIEFQKKNESGLIVFTSGSSGTPKGILHACDRVLNKFLIERESFRTVLFLLMDHFGGFNTFLGTFSSGGMAICIAERSAPAICLAIQSSSASLLPTTPTFINMLIASGAYRGYNLSSIKLITYGTEVMPEATLKKLNEIFPNATIKQTYGLSEVGVLRSKSKDNGSTWVKLGGNGFEVKILDGILWIRSEANMVGYLNAPSPFDSEGWLCTGDQVEINGDYVKIIGRQSEIINVGGQKVFPSEVEELLLSDPNVKDVSVYGVPHQLMGQVVNANISLIEDEDHEKIKIRLRKRCSENLAKYKIPLKFQIVDDTFLRNHRFKKVRKDFN